MTAESSDNQRSTSRENPQAVEQYKLARQEELRRLELQRVELEGMRTRTAQFLAFVGAGTGFLVGNGLSGAHRDATFYVIAGASTAISGLTILAAISVFVGGVQAKQRRAHEWSFNLRSGTILRAVEADIQPTESQLNAYLTRLYARMADENVPILESMRHQYLIFLSVGSVQLVGWITLLWARG